MRTVSTRAIELQNGMSALLVGAMLLHPVSTFATNPSYQVFASYAPEWVWGLVFLVLGVAQVLAAAWDVMQMRRIAAALIGLMFGVYCLGVLAVNPLGLTTPFVLPMVVGQGVAFFRIRRVA